MCSEKMTLRSVDTLEEVLAADPDNAGLNLELTYAKAVSEAVYEAGKRMLDIRSINVH